MSSPQPAPGTLLAPSGTTRLLLATEAPVYSTVQLTDARGALLRGLREYVMNLVWQADGGQELRFKACREGWAEPEQNAAFPSAAVYTQERGRYDSSSFTPQVLPRQRVEDTQVYLVQPCTLKQPLVLHLWCTSPKERMQLTALMEQALNPVLYRYGFMLELPFYFGAHASYSLEEGEHEEVEDQAARRMKTVQFSVLGEVPVLRPVVLPAAQPKFDLRRVGEGPDVLLQFEVK